MITKRELALTHIYPALARLSEKERRCTMLDSVGAYSSKELNQGTFEILMAELETILWQRVDAKQAPDPRACTVCGRYLKPGPNGLGQCPEGCELRKVYAWRKRYWRERLPRRNQAHSRLRWKILQIWELLVDYLPKDQRNERYLAGIIHKAAELPLSDLLSDSQINWHRITPKAAHFVIEALKDRLNYTVKS